MRNAKEKPCLPYTGQFKINIERTAEVYPPDRPLITLASAPRAEERRRVARSAKKK